MNDATELAFAKDRRVALDAVNALLSKIIDAIGDAAALDPYTAEDRKAFWGVVKVRIQGDAREIDRIMHGLACRWGEGK